MSAGSLSYPSQLLHDLLRSVSGLGRVFLRAVEGLGSVTLFCVSVLRALAGGLPSRRALVPVLYETGVRSVPVVLVTGMFIGMVLAVQSYTQFRVMHMESRLGAIITMTLVTELGPVLAAVMLAGRVGSAMAAELGTMKVTEQIDAMTALGADPIRSLVLPRFMACVLLIPLLTALADGVGIFAGWQFSSRALGVNSVQFWLFAEQYVTGWDVAGGLVKSVFFGCGIAVISCYRGFQCGAGAEGVGRAATASFVLSFIVILALDFVITVLLNHVYYMIWPGVKGLAG